MDGYAIKTSELIGVRDDTSSITHENDPSEPSLNFVIVGKVYAGDEQTVASFERNHRTAIYVTTGAVIPDGYDAVVPVEETYILESSHEGPKMHIISSKVQSVLNTKPWTWIRTVGCDIPSNSIVLSKGERIQPVHLALLTQVGLSLDDVRVKEFIRVGVLSTGNELTADGSCEISRIGKIPDVNRPLLLAQLSTYQNCEAVDLGIVTDDEGLDIISKRLNKALWDQDDTMEGPTRESVDLLITTGGISMGEKDIMEQVFVQGMGGKVHFGR
jgi:molybdopterin biosynthesis enzyme